MLRRPRDTKQSAVFYLNKMVLLINATVYCVSARRTVFPWQIIAVDPPDFTFRNSQLKARCDEVDSSRLQLKETFVGGKVFVLFLY